MKLSLCIQIAAVLLVCSCHKGKKTAVVADDWGMFTDMANRTIAIPKQINRVVSNNSPGTILLYTLADDLLVGRNYSASLSEQHYCSQHYCNLPVIGGWFGNNGTRNVEEIIKINPEIIISGGNTNQASKDFFDKDMERIKIPIIQVSTDLLSLTESYKILGKLLNKQKQADSLIWFIEKYIPYIIERASKIPIQDKKRIYLAIGENGLLTSPKGSLHSQVIRLAGGNNIVDISHIFGHVNVSIEQVIKWNPDIIILCGKGAASSNSIKQILLNDIRWKSISAIQQNKVYTVPTEPFCWVDMPPSVNQILGLIWLSNLLYPEIFDYDMHAITSEFYRLFYHSSLSPGIEEIQN